LSSNPGTLRFFPAQISALPSTGKPYDVADPASRTCFCGSALRQQALGCSDINGRESKLEFRSATSRTLDSRKRANERSRIKTRSSAALTLVRLNDTFRAAKGENGHHRRDPCPI